MEKTITTYFVKNTSKASFSLDTKLKSKEQGKQRFNYTFQMPAHSREYSLVSQGGYSAKEIFESPGLVEYAKKGFVRIRKEDKKVNVTQA